MTCALFKEFLTRLERTPATNQKILLFVDQCAAHPKDTNKLRSVREEFLPDNTTLVLQPMDNEVVET
jgi:hypothetical protein